MLEPLKNEKILSSYEDLQQFCQTFAGVTAEFPFGPTPLVMKVAGKMFALISPTEPYPTISLKGDPFMNELLRAQYASIKPGYHLNKQHWITIEVDGTIPNQELQEMITNSYQLVLKKLPKAVRAQLINE